MIYKCIAFLIAGLFLFPCIAQAESEPMFQRLESLTKNEAFMSGRLTGVLNTVCALREVDQITEPDMRILLSGNLGIYRKTSSNEAIEYALDGLKTVSPNCYKHFEDAL